MHPLSDVQTTTSKAFKVEHEVSSVSAISQSDVVPSYTPLPTPASQLKEKMQEPFVKRDASDFKPHVNTQMTASFPFVTKPEKSLPVERFKSEPPTTPLNISSSPQSSPQSSHTQLEQVLLQTLQHLTQQSAHQVRRPQLESLRDKARWQAIADALKKGPTLPKIELMKFGGDPSEYGEFVANFRDHIESQVSDDLQRLTRLLAQYVGKARDNINLNIGRRCSEAWKTLSKNFRQSHMVAGANMRRWREYNPRRGDAESLMDFARRC